MSGFAAVCSSVAQRELVSVAVQAAVTTRIGTWLAAPERRGRVVAATAVVVLGITVPAIALARSGGSPVPTGQHPSAETHLLAAATYPNTSIAQIALRYVGRWGGYACADAHRSAIAPGQPPPVYPAGYSPGNPPTAKSRINPANGGDGQCRSFVDCILWMASGGLTGSPDAQWIGGSYFDAFLHPANGGPPGIEITDASRLIEGDIVQIGNSDSAANLHTFIIVAPLGGNTYKVVDSNWNLNEFVGTRTTSVVLNPQSERAFRMGLNTDTTLGHTAKVQGDNQTAWFVSPSDGDRHWIPDSTTYACLSKPGDPLTLAPSAAAGYPVDAGGWATCPGSTSFDGAIIRETDKKSFVISGGQRHLVPDYPSDLCSQYVEGRKEAYPGETFSPKQIGSIPNGRPYGCSLGPAILTASDKPDPKPSYTYAAGKKHAIPDAATYGWLTRNGYSRVIPMPQSAIDGIASGPAEPLRINPPDNSIVVETQLQVSSLAPAASLVFKSGKFYEIPDVATDLCALYVNGLPVSLTNVDPKVVQASYPIAPQPYSCSLTNTVLRALDRGTPAPAYAVYGGKRHWISDAWTYSYLLKHGFTKHDVKTEAEIKQLVDGGTEPPKLDPSDIPANTIVRRNDGVSWVVDGSHVRHHIPYAQDDVCWRDLRGVPVSATNLTSDEATEVGAEKDAWPCVIGDRVVRSSDGSSWHVDTSNKRHHILDSDTYSWWAHTVSVIGPWPASDVNQLPQGADEAYKIWPPDVANSIICRNDGVCWAVDGAGTRHHIPTYGDNVCWRWVNGWHVSRNGLNYDQASSLGEAGAWSCSMNNSIIADSSGASWWIDAGNVRHHILTAASYYCYADRGARIIRGMSSSEASGLQLGSDMTGCLSPGRIRNTVVRRTDGTAWFVDGGGTWHHITTTWSCVTARHPISYHDATYDEVRSVYRAGSDATCSM